MRTQKQWIKHLDFTILDMGISALAFLAACALRPGSLRRLFRVLPVYPQTLAALVITAALIGLLAPVHKSILRRGFWKECTETFKFVVLQAVLASFYNYITKVSNDLSRFVFAIYLVLAFVLLLAGRTLYKSAVNRHLTAGDRLPRLVLVTDAEHARKRVASYGKNGEKQFRIAAAAVLDEQEDGKRNEDPKAGMAENLPGGVRLLKGRRELYRFLQEEVADEILLTDSKMVQDEELLQKLMSAGMTIYISLDDIYEILPNKHMDRIANEIVLASTVQPFSPEQMLVKRLFDIGFSLAGLLVTAVVLLIFGPVIYVQSPGPVFYSQIRVGMNGRRFRMYKFRSMYPDADARKAELMGQNKMNGFMFKVDNDPRIIPVGRFMRKYSLDELPQFFNVLRGEMSTVGTRPPTVDEWEQYSLEHRARLSMKPGVTGLWQVSGRNDIVDFDEVVALDMKYIREWNLKKDIRIIGATIGVVFTGRGAS